MAAITFDRDGNGTTATLAHYLGTGHSLSETITTQGAGVGTNFVRIPLNAIAEYAGAAAGGVSDNIVEVIYCILRRVEDTYNGQVGALVAADTGTAPAGTKPTNFSISRVETDSKAIFTVALPLSKTTTTAAGSL
jgi:hypothetical protein